MFDFLSIFLKMINVLKFLSVHLQVEQMIAVCIVSIVASVTYVSVMEYRYRAKVKIH